MAANFIVNANLFPYNSRAITTLTAAQASTIQGTTGTYIGGPYSGPIAGFTRNNPAFGGAPPKNSTLYTVALPPATVPSPGPANAYGFATPPGSAVPISPN